MTKETYLSVIIPAYNEERRIPKTILDIIAYLEKQNYESEIIVVNDGSRDETAQAVIRLQPRFKNLVLIDNKENHGKGFVVRQGLMEARGKIRLFTDADNATSIDHIEKMIPEFQKGFDLVIGSRDIKGAILANPQPFYRIMLGNIFNLMTQVLVGLWGIWDMQCGFKAMTDRAANTILPRCRIDRWAFDPEILAVAKRMKFKIKEVPVVWVNDPESKVKFGGMVKMGIDLLNIRWNLIVGNYGRS